jgi:hypothetical protein
LSSPYGALASYAASTCSSVPVLLRVLMGVECAETSEAFD